MKQWHPVPAELAAALVKRTWTKENQAPEAVAYLWTWSVMWNGVTVSIRDLGNYAGWSKWKARNMRERVRLDFDAWESAPGIPHQTGQSPDSRRTPTGQSPDTQPHKHQEVTEVNQTPTGQSPDTNRTVTGRSRVIPYTNTNKTTITKHTKSKERFDLVGIWARIQEKRKSEIPGAVSLVLTDHRKRQLKGRLHSHSEAELMGVVEWWLKATHPRARYLRQEGHGIDTVLRPSNFGQYLDFSRESKPKPILKKKPEPPKKQELPGISTYPVEQVDSAKEALADLRPTMKPSTWRRAIETYLHQMAK